MFILRRRVFVDNKRHKKREIPPKSGISTYILYQYSTAFCGQDNFLHSERDRKNWSECTNQAEAVYRYCESAGLFAVKRHKKENIASERCNILLLYKIIIQSPFYVLAYFYISFLYVPFRVEQIPLYTFRIGYTHLTSFLESKHHCTEAMAVIFSRHCLDI